MGVQVADDRLDEVGCGAVAAHVSCPHLADFDHLLHCICNHVGVILETVNVDRKKLRFLLQCPTSPPVFPLQHLATSPSPPQPT